MNTARLTDLLTLAAIQLYNYCLDMFRCSQTISKSTLGKELLVMPGRSNIEQLNKLRYQYTYAVKMPSKGKVYFVSLENNVLHL